MPLSDVSIRNAKPSQKPSKLADGGGLYLLLNPNGAKWWRLDYRFAGKRKTLSMGVYPEVGLKAARDKRDEARRLLADGIDPGENRKIQKAARYERSENSFEVVAREWFAKFSPNWATSHATKIISRLERDVFPWLGGRPIGEIKAAELLRAIKKIESRGVLETAHRALQNCSQIFRYAVAHGLCERDLAFMQSEKNALEVIEAEIKSILNAMENVDFERAQRYVNSLSADDRSYADQLLEWQGRNKEVCDRQSVVQKPITKIELRLDALENLIPRVHQTIFDLIGKLTQLNRLPDSVRNTLSATLPSEIRGYAETVSIAALSTQAGTSEEIVDAWHNLYVTIGSEININVQELADTARKLNEAQQSFSNERDYYCQRARNGEIKGLNSLEIEFIENAKTVEKIRQFSELRDVIQKQIDDLHSNLDKITQTMETNRSATIENLSKLAKQASSNKSTLDRVMSKHPSARFEISCEIADEDKIKSMIESLILEIQDREKALREKKTSLSNVEIRERDLEYRNLIHRKIYSGIFTETKVEFVHDAIRAGKTLFSEPGERLSTGQHTALAMMWLVRHAEYVQTRVAMMHGTRREQKKALRGSQRVMFFDGLFSNLSNESYINAAFHGLKDVGDNFQLIGLIHNPYYVNNPQIFPTHLIGKRVHGQTSDRTFMAFKPWQSENGMLFATTAMRQKEEMHA